MSRTKPVRVSGLGLLVVVFAIGVVEAQVALDWKVEFERGIEWCQAVGDGSSAGVLVCTKDARLDLIDMATGWSRFGERMLVQSGSRYAGEGAGVAYIHGVSEVYAVSLDEDESVGGAALLWSLAAAPAAETAGDPEFMVRIVAARATPNGVLIVRSDGRMAELSRGVGEVRWRAKLPEMSFCRLHVRHGRAALLWKKGDEFSVGFIDLAATSPGMEIVSVERTPPIRSWLIGSELVAIWPERVGIVAVGRGRDFLELESRVGAWLMRQVLDGVEDWIAGRWGIGAYTKTYSRAGLSTARCRHHTGRNHNGHVIRDAFRIDKQLIIVEAERVLAYTLP